MNSRATEHAAACPDCGAINPARAGKCWLCGRDLTPKIPPRPAAPATPVVSTNPYAAPLAPVSAPPQFGLSSLFLIVTLACICLGLASIAPGLIVPLLVVAVPALVRTFAKSARSAARGERSTVADKIGAFFTSVFLMWMIMAAGSVAFFGACAVGLGVATATRQPDTAIIVALAAAGIFSLAVMIALFVKTWPRAK